MHWNVWYFFPSRFWRFYKFLRVHVCVKLLWILMLFCALLNTAFPAQTAVWILQEESKSSSVNSDSNQVWFECVFLVEEHAVLEGILSGRPGSPQSCTGAGLPLDGDGWVTLPSHGRGAPGCRAASGVEVNTVHSLIRSQYCVWSRTLALSSRADGFTFESKGPGGVFAARLQFKDQRKDSNFEWFQKSMLWKRKKDLFPLGFLFFSFFQQFSWWQPFDALRANF